MNRAGHPESYVCVLHRLKKARGAWVRSSDLVAAIWTDRGLREPVEAKNYMRKQIVRLRHQGHVIQSQYGYGYRLIREAA